jgi:hypothetical protein
MKTAVDELIEKIQLEFNLSEEFYLEHKTRESYLVCRTFQLCLKFAKEAKEMELDKLKEAYSMGRMNKSIKEFNETFNQQ